MTKEEIPALDPYANLTEAYKRAAVKAGYAVPYISEEAKFAAGQKKNKLGQNSAHAPDVSPVVMIEWDMPQRN